MDPQLQQLWCRLGELDTVVGDIDRERDQVRAAIAQRRAALQVQHALAATAADTPTAKMKVVRK
jgi:hypothetical protein